METARWMFVVALSCVWAFYSLDNGRIAWRQIVGDDDGRPFSPLLGGLVGGAAVFLAPVSGLADRIPWVLVPVVIDFGSLPYLILCLVGPKWTNVSLRSLASRQDVTTRNRFGQTPLHAAALLNQPTRCRELIELGADICARDRWGQTPLDRATLALSDEAAQVIADAAGIAYKPLPRNQP